MQADDALTALQFDETGLMCGVGTSGGLVAIFDLRSSKPLTVKDHMYSSPIVDLKFKESDNQTGELPDLQAWSLTHLDKYMWH